MLEKKFALVIGSGGHSRVLISLLRAQNAHNILGILELGDSCIENAIMGVPIVGTTSEIDRYINTDDLDFFLAIGDNYIRKIWWEKLKNLGCNLPNLISPHAIIDPAAILGESNVICARAFVGPGAILCDNNLVNTGSIIEHEVSAGSHCHFAPLSVIAGRSTINDECFFGAGSVVIHCVSINRRTIVGAGSVVISDIVKTGQTYIGCPAKNIGHQKT